MPFEETPPTQPPLAPGEPPVNRLAITTLLSSEVEAEILTKPHDSVLRKEQQVMGMLSADGSTRQTSTVIPHSYVSDDDDDDEEERSYRDAKGEQSCLKCAVM
ncbi:hypothetical protein LTR84_008929 [Exophiala bonariae]|uniref:Uncharacterized protein n=1 Tax=Exophiala bonariae TaxID=1690606 RepID=A0AAV9MYW9_9EURO|nr:hypothetical protein LTR84_008929 [Exophiala bonariae]